MWALCVSARRTQSNFSSLPASIFSPLTQHLQHQPMLMADLKVHRFRDLTLALALEQQQQQQQQQQRQQQRTQAQTQTPSQLQLQLQQPAQLQSQTLTQQAQAQAQQQVQQQQPGRAVDMSKVPLAEEHWVALASKPWEDVSRGPQVCNNTSSLNHQVFANFSTI